MEAGAFSSHAWRRDGSPSLLPGPGKGVSELHHGSGRGWWRLSLPFQDLMHAFVRDLQSRSPYAVQEIIDEVGVPELNRCISEQTMHVALRPGGTPELPRKELQSDPAITLESRRAASSTKRFRAMCGLVGICVTVESLKVLLANWEHATKKAMGLPTPYAPFMLLVKNVVSTLLGLMFSAVCGGWTGLKQAANPTRVLTMLPVALFFASGQLCALKALAHFDAGSLKVFAQISIPTTALLSRILLGRSYSWIQWQALVFLAFGSMAFIEVRILFETRSPSPLALIFKVDGSASQGCGLASSGGTASCRGGDGGSQLLVDALKPGGTLEGLGLVGMAVVLGCLGSVLGERFLKRDFRHHYHIQKCNLMLGECICSAAMLGFAPVLEGSSFSTMAPLSAGWDWRSYLVVAAWVVHGWVAGLVAKKLSALTKSFAHILSTVVCYAVAAAMWPRVPFFPRCIPGTLTAGIVLLCVFMFATAEPLSRSRRGQNAAGAKQSLKRNDSKSSSSGSIADLARAKAALANSAQLEDALKPLLPRRRNNGGLSQAAASSGSGAIAGPAVYRACPPWVSARAWCSGTSVLLIAFVLLDATRPLLVSWAQQGGPRVCWAFAKGSFMLAQTSVSFLVALIMARAYEGSAVAAWRLCTESWSIMRQVPVAFCITISKLFLVMALARMDAGTVRVVTQLGLPMMAVGSAMLGRHYSLLQWQAIWMIGLSVVDFFLVKNEADRARFVGVDDSNSDDTDQGFLTGDRKVALFLIAGSLGANCFAALVSERFLKAAGSPYYAQKAHLLGGECLINLGIVVSSWLHIPRSEESAITFLEHITRGWDHRTLITMLVWIPSGWCATLVVRNCCALTKNMAQSAGAVLTYLFSVQPVTIIGPALTPEPILMPVVLLAIVCMQSVVLFVVASEEGGKQSVKEVSSPPTDEVAARETSRPGMTRISTIGACLNELGVKPTE